MKINIEVKINPFIVPTMVEESDIILELDGRQPRRFHLNELSPEVLEQLCEDFTEEVFKIAGKSRTPRVWE